MEWHSFKLTLKTQKETDNHPHSPHELAHMFTSVQFEDTEIDFLDLLYGIIRAKKPQTVLETGTHLGLSALAIGFALRDNNKEQLSEPHLHTVEKDVEDAYIAKDLFTNTGLDKFISVYICDSLDFIKSAYTGPPFEIVFFDSSRTTRPEEFYQLRARNLISEGCILLFHDTSDSRAESLPNQGESQSIYLSSLKQIAYECRGTIKFDLSRGLTVMQWVGH